MITRRRSPRSRALFGAAGVPWMVIGGIAIIARGVRRKTTDIDVVVRGDETTPAALLRALATRRIVPRIDDAEAFARESVDRGVGGTNRSTRSLAVCRALHVLG